MNFFNFFRKPSLAIFLSATILFMSCEQYEDRLNGDSVNEHSMRTSESSSKYDRESYFAMMTNLSNNIDRILTKSKPQGITLAEYKVKLVNGDLTLSQQDMDEIFDSSEDLIDYGREIAIIENIGIDTNDVNELMSIGLFAPDIDFSISYPIETPVNVYQPNGDITWGEVAICAAVAIGADAIWALSGSTATTWTIASITKAFTAVAKRFLGPIGVAIAVIAFGVCLAEMAAD